MGGDGSELQANAPRLAKRLGSLLLLLACFAPASVHSAQPGGTVSRLGPENAGPAAAIREALAGTVAQGLGAPLLSARELRIVVFAPEGSEPRHEDAFIFRAPGSPGVATQHGALTFPLNIAPARHKRWVQVLEALPQHLKWTPEEATRPTYDRDGRDAKGIQRERQRAARRLRGLDVGPAEAVDDPRRDGFHRWLSAPTPSGWQHRGGTVDRGPASLQRLANDREHVRGAPKLWALAAWAAMLNGEPNRALALSEVSMRFGRQDADADAVWHALSGTRLEGQTSGTRSLTHPLLGDDAFPWGGALCLLLGGLLWVFLGRQLGRRGFILLGCVALLAALTFVRASESSHLELGERRSAQLPERLLAPLAGGRCVADPAFWAPHGLTVFATCGSHEVAFEIRPQGKSVRVDVFGEGAGSQSGAAAQRLKELATESIREGWRLTGRPKDSAGVSRRGGPLRANDRLERGMAAALALLALCFGGLAFLQFGRAICMRCRADPPLGRGLLLVLAAAVFAHLWVDSRMVMVYTGYDLTSRLGELDQLPRYGAGTLWLYRPFLAWGVDHAHVQGANRLFGLLLMLPTLALSLKAAPRGRWGVWLTAAVVGLSPLFLRDHSSEGIQTGSMLVMMTGLALFESSLDGERGRFRLLAALPLLGFALVCRPEAGAAMACTCVGLLVHRRKWVLAHRPLVFGAASVLLLWSLPHVLWLLHTAADLATLDDISAFDSFTLQRVHKVLFGQNLLLHLQWGGPMIALVALFGLLRHPTRWAHAGWWLGAVVWLALSSVDLPVVSLPRVHLPALLLLLPVFAAGVELIEAKRWALGATVGALLWVACFPGSPTLESSNGDEEEAMIRLAQTELQKTTRSQCLARMSLRDPPHAGRTPRYFPDYLFLETRLLGLQEVDDLPPECQDGTYVLLGSRCYMGEDRAQAGGPRGMHSVCQTIRDRPGLETLAQRVISHHPVSTLPMFSAEDELEIGLYWVPNRPGSPPP